MKAWKVTLPLTRTAFMRSCPPLWPTTVAAVSGRLEDLTLKVVGPLALTCWHHTSYAGLKLLTVSCRQMVDVPDAARTSSVTSKPGPYDDTATPVPAVG